ncbi:BnaA04g17430D [Brassica napus]|uniref:BnaA04g17430D protein n=1 Tax=Brassica napus TaxID=3708 RepID=A0A078GWZ9_BRANA|nr:BnaA04g17430D [Brassica napus]
MSFTLYLRGNVFFIVAAKESLKSVNNRQLHRMLSLSNWRSGNKELHERCSLFYDVIRVDAEEKPVCIFSSYSRLTSLEDQKLLASFLPLLRESIYMIGAVVPWSYYTLLCPRNRKSRKKLILDYI